MTKFLLIGKCRTESNPSSAGGVIVLFEQLISDFTRLNKNFEILDLNRRNYLLPNLGVLLNYIKAMIKLPFCDIVFFNGTAGEYKYYSWFFTGFGKLFRKKVVLRKFAGNFDHYYDHEISGLSKKAIDYALKNADINYFETMYLIEHFKTTANNPRWFPNVRSVSDLAKKNNPFSKRFVFISNVKRDKGIQEILEARKDLPATFIIDIYGPLNYDCPSHLKDAFKMCYKGVLSSNEVIKTLQKYDVLLLPTYHKGEGYPGIIIEAFAAGLPVIVTPLKGIKEMVTENASGFFVNPKDSEALKQKIKYFTSENYSIYSEQAKNDFRKFNNEDVMKRIIHEIHL
ncbi:glycosyltransferase family 4 protein [Christiangramia sp. SM2212]|uniref:Glycosyltransferase family 4 protein n=1 Tax=Christiangramia sediminicola TaxID=3073267 RepID=A0ABU1ELR9_9FLAO|nr:glycosyltransferase family 4 protein [Christiangramia sp. SM2212]MDR5589338.1 glycosyltransferase family 4 protein [Christiangramia sp. SM2212]